MKPGRLSFTIPALAVGALALGATAAATVPSAWSAAHPAHAKTGASRTVVFTCARQAQVRPQSFVLTCADGNSAVAGLSWSAWTPSQAKASGKEQENTCTPDCAQGTIRSYPARVMLSRAKPVPHHPGEKYFTRMTIHYPGARPPVYNARGQQLPGPQTRTVGLWS